MSMNPDVRKIIEGVAETYKLNGLPQCAAELLKVIDNAERYAYIKGQMRAGTVSTLLPLERTVFWVGNHLYCSEVNDVDRAIDDMRGK